MVNATAVLVAVDGPDGMAVEIVANTVAGFNVRLFDAEAGETVGCFVGLATIEAAKAKAAELLGVEVA